MKNDAAGGILLVDDDKAFRSFLGELFEGIGYATRGFASGAEVLAAVADEPPAAILLDVQLPGLNGYEICRALRDRYGDSIAIVFISGERTDPLDRAGGMLIGADDYLVKPFALPELLARIRALFRRGRPSDVLRLKAADLELDLVTRRVTRGDALVDLTAREFELLEYLLRHQGHLVSREMLAREVWREPRRATPLDNVIDVQMTRLRKKVDPDSGPRLIHTVRGVGFVLREGEP